MPPPSSRAYITLNQAVHRVRGREVGQDLFDCGFLAARELKRKNLFEIEACGSTAFFTDQGSQGPFHAKALTEDEVFEFEEFLVDQAMVSGGVELEKLGDLVGLFRRVCFRFALSLGFGWKVDAAYCGCQLR